MVLCALALAGNETLVAPMPSKENLHVYLLIGQSNMAGRAPLAEGDMAPIPRCLLLNGSDEWEPARNPLNRHSSIRKDVSAQKMNPGYAFALTMAEQDKASTFGLVVNARGGTRIEEWGKGGVFYDEAIRRTKVAMKTGTLKGILWHQGEGNANDEAYLEKLQALVSAFRSDFGMPDLPFVVGEVREGTRVNAQLSALPERVPATSCVSAKGLKTQDAWHFDAPSMRLLGQRYAEAILKLQTSAPAPLP